MAKNEILFRDVNERIVELTDRWGGTLDVICECANPDCTSPVPMSLHEYELLRQNPHRFVVLPGHEMPEMETVVEHGERYLIVEKHEETKELVERAHRRAPN